MVEFYRESRQPCLEEYGIEFFPLQHKSSGMVTRAHIHPAIEFIYITSGKYEVGIDNELHTAKSGDLLLFRSNAIHTLKYIEENDTVGEYFVLKINPSLLFQIFTGNDSVSCVIPFIHKSVEDISFYPSHSLPDETRDILEAMISEYKSSDRFFHACERAHAARFLISLLRHVFSPKNMVDDGDISEKSVALIHKSVNYINENYASDITPANCAASIHLSYSYFAKLFRAVMGMTFKEYLTGVRIAKAHSVLISTDLSITDVSAACGYSNLSYFISEYKKLYGKTPKDTRKELSGKQN